MTETLSTPSGRPPPLAFEALFYRLRRRGFDLGVDHQLRLARLLEEIQGECVPGDLCALLGPVFATNAEQQRVFRQVFYELYPHFRPPGSAPDMPFTSKVGRASTKGEPKDPKGQEDPGSRTVPRRWPFLVGLAVIVAALFLAGTTFLLVQPGPAPSYSASEPGQGSSRPEEAAAGVEGSPRRVREVLARTSPSQRQAALTRSARWTATFLPLVLLLLVVLHRWRHSVLVLRVASHRSPPFVWPLRFAACARPAFGREELRAASQRLMRRYPGPVATLDVPATVAATVAAGGRVELRHRASTRVPEYVALVDRRGPGDHRAGMAEELLSSLGDEGVELRRFSFDHDPRRVEGPGGAGVGIADLRERYDGSRLLVFGDGEALLDPLSGGFNRWTEVFLSWRHRALLTPLPPECWGRAEITLAGRFLVVPATVDGLGAAARYLALEEAAVAPGGPWVGDVFPTVVEDASDLEGTVSSLRESLGPAAFQWLCACAVHADLQWDLTLYLATLPGMDPDLLGEENLLRLVRLPWFREGRIPGPLRWRLIQELEPALEREVRSALVRLLGSSAPPERSVANESRELQVVLHEARLRGPDDRIQRFLPSRFRRDEADLRLVETFRSGVLDLVIPKRLRRALYRGGVPIFGLRLWPLALTSTVATVVLAWALLSGTAPAQEMDQVAKAVPPSMEERLISEPLPSPEVDLPADVEVPAGAEAEPESGPGVLTVETEPSLEPETGGSPTLAEETETTVAVVPLPVEGGGEEALPDWAQVLPGEAAAGPAAATPPRGSVAQAESLDDPQEEVLEESLEETDDFTVVLPFEPGIEDMMMELPVGRYRYPVDFVSVLAERGKDWLDRPFLDITAVVANAGGPAQIGTLLAKLLDRNGRVVATETLSERLDEGDFPLRIRFRPGEEALQDIAGVRLSVDVTYEPGPIRRLTDRLRSKADSLPLIDPGRISVDGNVATVLVPVSLGEARLDLHVRPIAYETVRTRVSAKSISVTVWSSNPSAKDHFVIADASLLDVSGRVLATGEGRRSVEEGERRKSFTITLRLSPDELELAQDIRLVLQAEPD